MLLTSKEVCLLSQVACRCRFLCLGSQFLSQSNKSVSPIVACEGLYTLIQWLSKVVEYSIGRTSQT